MKEIPVSSKRKTINVTQMDCDLGFAGDCYLCPVARAIGRAVKRLGLKVHTTTFKATFYRDQGLSVLETYLPPEVSTRISDFDSGHGMKPFRFELEVPDVTG